MPTFNKTMASEAAIQTAIVRLCRYVLPKTHRVFAVPNGSTRNAKGRPANAVAGLTRGIPDLCIVGGGRAYFLEVKTAKGRLTPEQEEFGNWCLLQGLCGWAVVRSVDDAKAALEHWQIIRNGGTNNVE